jgi:hypothetical protein
LKTAKQMLLATLLVAACGTDKESITSAGDDDDTSSEGSSSSAGGGSKPGSGGSSSSGGGGKPSTGSDLKDGTCESASVGSRKTTPDMLIVLDRSGSMAPNGNPMRTDRWRGSVDAVLQVTQEFSSRINFGLMTFPAFDPNDPGGATGIINGIAGAIGGMGGAGFTAAACKAGTVNVEIGKNKAPDIMQVLSTMTPSGLTPTSGSLEAALGAIGSARQQGDEVVPPKYVLLITDGDPNCSQGAMMGQAGFGGGGIDPAARTETIAAIEKLRNEGVQTFVVGYQTAGSNFVQQLDMMAAAGGTGDTMHRSVSTAADLSKTFDEIAGRALSCSYKLEMPVEDPTYVRVTVAGAKPKFENSADGWTLGTDKQTVTLTGAACDTVQAGAVFKVEVDCEPVFVQ